MNKAYWPCLSVIRVAEATDFSGRFEEETVRGKNRDPSCQSWNLKENIANFQVPMIWRDVLPFGSV